MMKKNLQDFLEKNTILVGSRLEFMEKLVWQVPNCS
jgi:hypothetical protein